MRVLLLFLPFLPKFTNPCLPTRSTTPIVCACSTDEVALLNNINGAPGSDNSIQPVGTVAQTDSNNCPTIYTVTCESTTGGTVYMEFQDSLSAAIQTTSLNLTCTDGNWLYSDATNGVTLVVSVQCQQT
ncbi:unnamed protein product [Caenorhabditis sp. 36 PRJEB53466]|nr:unnamed protein product [Caenorhabditis sp. 36 PRJEB53466]